MDAPIFCRPVDGPISALTIPRAAGAGSLTLADASKVGSPSPAAPVRLTVIAPDRTVILGQFLAVGRSGNVVAIVPQDGYPDVMLPAGSLVDCTASAADMADVQDAILAAYDAIDALQVGAGGVTSVAGRTGAVVLNTADIGGLGSIATHSAGDYLTPTGSGSGLTGLNASALATGTAPPARLGSGTPSTSTYLRGDGSWSTPPSAPVTSVAGRTGAVVLSTADVSGLATVASSGAYADLQGRPLLAPVATSGQYADLSNRPTLGTLAALSSIGALVAAGANVTITGAGTATSPLTIAAAGGSGGSATPGGSNGQVQVNVNGAFGGSTALVSAATNPLTITLDNTDYNNTNAANSALVLNNPNTLGQTAVCSVINGQVMAKWRTDFEGSVNWIADGPKGGHHFFVGGDYGVGTDALMILRSAEVIVQCTTDSGLTVKAAGFQLRDLVQFKDGTTPGNVIASISSKGEYRPPGLADGSASAGSLYYSATASKLAYKDPGGTVHYLY